MAEVFAFMFLVAAGVVALIAGLFLLLDAYEQWRINRAILKLIRKNEVSVHLVEQE